MTQSVYAATTDLSTLYKPAEALGGQNATIAGFIFPLVVDIMILGGILAFFTIIFAGFQYITGGGDKTKMAQAQNMLNYAIMGLVLIVASFVITNLISALVGFDFLSGKEL